MWRKLMEWARRLHEDVLTLYYCAKHPQTPLPAKLLALLIAAYALSPIDLIPDFIPILGYLDELLLLPGLIWICLKLIPQPTLAQCRSLAHERVSARRDKPRSYAGAAIVVGIWMVLLWGAWLLFGSHVLDA
jgi:uncharacterized membrane protein YkvA (DUF1232 family)